MQTLSQVLSGILNNIYLTFYYNYLKYVYYIEQKLITSKGFNNT